MTLTDEQLRYLQKGLERSRTAIVEMATELLAARARLHEMEGALRVTRSCIFEDMERWPEPATMWNRLAKLVVHIDAALAQPAVPGDVQMTLTDGLESWPIGTLVEKIKGASWRGRVVGYYATSLTPEGYCVESEREPGSVQIYPRAAIHEVKP